jgi:alpha-L-rhamnosidase
LVAQSSPAVRLTQELTPIGSTPASGLSWGFHGRIYDMGQNMVGTVRLRAQAPAGTTLTFKFGEMLDAGGRLYVENLRSAQATDHYTFSGQGEEIWQPRFTFHGFRYVEVLARGDYELPEGCVTGLVYHSDYEPGGHFECSDPQVNQLQSNINWGWRGNSLDIPTDCPQRDERLGWTGDAQVFVGTAAYNWDVDTFFSRWQRDLRDAQDASGSIPMVVPSVLGPDGGPAWADAVLIVPWTLYRFYGDKRLLAENYDVFTRFAQYLQDTSRDNLRCFEGTTAFAGFGDWLAQDGSDHGGNGTPRELIGTAFHAHAADLMSQIAGVLGKSEDAALYAERFAAIRRAFNERFVTPAGLVSPGTQTACVLALHFGLLPEEARPGALAQLAADIERHGTHLTTGFVGSSYLNPVLSRGGYNQLAYRLLAQTTWPSWLYPVTQGATTIWERWDGWTAEKGFADAGMNSFNHYAYGAIGQWLYATVAGIDVDACSPGMSEITLRPLPGGDLTYARASYASPQGTIESYWRLEGDRFCWDVTVPPNCLATLVLPGSGTVTEAGLPLTQTPHLDLLDASDGAQIIRAASGSYQFGATRASLH